MGVEAAIALASAAAGSTATEAGRYAWESLVALGRRLVRREGADPAEPLDPDPGDEAQVRALTGRIADTARSDDAFAAELCRWAETHRAALAVDQTQVHNTVAPGARVQGPVVQARDISGGVSFGP